MGQGRGEGKQEVGAASNITEGQESAGCRAAQAGSAGSSGPAGKQPEERCPRPRPSEMDRGGAGSPADLVDRCDAPASPNLTAHPINAQL